MVNVLVQVHDVIVTRRAIPNQSGEQKALFSSGERFLRHSTYSVIFKKLISFHRVKCNDNVKFKLSPYSGYFVLQTMRTQCFVEPPVQGNSERNGDRGRAPNVAVVLTDGGSNDQSQTILMAERAKSNGIYIIPVGVSSGINFIELRGIASDPNEVIQVEDFDKLDNIVNQLVEKTCQADSKHTLYSYQKSCVKNKVYNSCDLLSQL